MGSGIVQCLFDVIHAFTWVLPSQDQVLARQTYGLFEQRMCGLQQAAVQEVAVHHLLLMRLGQNMHVIQQSCTVL